MPSPSEILSGLEVIANEAFWLAVLWHALIGAAIVALVRGWRPAANLTAALLAVPAASVSVLAWVYGNPFNGGMFVVLTLMLLGIARGIGAGRVRGGAGWARWAGIALIGYAWVYPHFLPAYSPMVYLVASPVGLVPCPTLAVIMGFTLLADASLPTTWRITLGVFGVLYALFGALRLGVWLDAGLLAGAVAVLLTGRRPSSSVS